MRMTGAAALLLVVAIGARPTWSAMATDALPAGSLTVPASASIHGFNGTYFRTDLRLLNQSYTDPVTVDLDYAGGGHSGSVTLAPREARELRDVVGIFFAAPETSGGITIRWSGGPVIASSRTYTDGAGAARSFHGGWCEGRADHGHHSGSSGGETLRRRRPLVVRSDRGVWSHPRSERLQPTPDGPRVFQNVYRPSDGNGTIGTDLPALYGPLSGRFAFLGVASNGGDARSGFRTNVGASGYGFPPPTVFLFDSSGRPLGNPVDLYLPADTPVQVNDIFAAAGVPSTVTTNATLVLDSRGSAIYPYVTVIDNRSSDSVALVPQVDVLPP